MTNRIQLQYMSVDYNKSEELNYNVVFGQTGGRNSFLKEKKMFLEAVLI